MITQYPEYEDNTEISYSRLVNKRESSSEPSALNFLIKLST